MSWHDAIHEMLSTRDAQIAELRSACRAAEWLLSGAVDLWLHQDQAIAFIDGSDAQKVLAMLRAAIGTEPECIHLVGVMCSRETEDAVTDDPDDVTCPDCLRLMGRSLL